MNKALRSLSRNPALLATAILLLAIGIGATTALFSVVNTVLLAPLPYEQPDRLVRMWTELAARNVPHFPESPTVLEDMREQATLFETIAGVNTGGGIFARPGAEPRQVQLGNITWDFLAMLGVEPVIGRNFAAADSAFSATDVPPGAPFPLNAFANPRVALISHGLWQSEFGGSPGVIGNLVEVNGASAEVVGVLPRGFRLHMAPVTGVAPDVDVWVPLRVDFATAPRNNVFLNLAGRLRDGVTLEQARAQLEAVAERMYDLSPVMRTAGSRVHVMAYGEELIADVRGVIWALLGAAVLVLLIACANVANLLLVRAAGQARELAIRNALGASRGHLIRGMLSEATVLACAGTMAGILLAFAGLALVLESAPTTIPRLDAVAIDWRVLVFAAALALATTVLAGLLPALQGSRLAVAGALRDRSTAALGGSNKLRMGLVAGEIALSFVLLIGAALMVRSFVALHQVDLGFNPDNVLTFQVNLPAQDFPEFDQRRQLYYALQERLADLPGVVSAAAAAPLPLTNQPFNGRYTNVQPAGDDTPYRQANYRVILPGYFETLQTPLLAGRHLTRDDEINERAVVVIDNLLAQAAWQDRDPLGQQIWLRLNQPEPVAFEVVGVVHRQLQDSLHGTPRESVYFTAGSTGQFGVNAWALRTAMRPENLLPLVRREVAALAPNVPVAQVRMMGDYVDGAMERTRFALQLIGAFGIAALVIAAVGLYAAIHFVVRSRRAEIGVRMSFGARPGDIFRLFLRHGLSLALTGIVLGLAAAVALSRTIAGLLVDVAPTDPATYAAIALFFLLIALVASAIPAMRAARLSPMTVLRSE